jgi:hypothetical protein
MEEAIEANPNLDHAQWRFQLSLADDLVPNKAELKQKLLADIEKDSMFILIVVYICSSS